MDKLTAIKIKYDDGTYSDEIPVGVLSENVEWDSTHTLVDVLGNVDSSTKGTLQDQIDKLSAQGAGAHNSIYRGKDLGTSVTYKQWAAINAGTFDDLYIGDYWVINGVNWRIAAFDYYLNTGDTNCTTHHVVIVPDTCLGSNKRMNSSNITTGGYTGSEMYTTNLADAKTLINNAFGSAHILNHRQYLTTTVANGRPSAGSWFNSTVELMNEQNVYGGKFFAPTSDGSTWPALYTIDKSQFPLFALEPSRITNRVTYWLRDVVSAAGFAHVGSRGDAGATGASDPSRGVRPAFSIKS